MKRLIILEEKEEDPLLRMNKSFEIGIDEVGRGCIFGPVFSAAVVLSKKNGYFLRTSPFFFEIITAAENTGPKIQPLPTSSIPISKDLVIRSRGSSSFSSRKINLII